mmetsp:Transcript_24086/g.65149  ORF Transcript_24086/g.65149 Transcript_24086/m.65149 type:complete len:291 (-) Transcript_24086:553-1425(-)
MSRQVEFRPRYPRWSLDHEPRAWALLCPGGAGAGGAQTNVVVPTATPPTAQETSAQWLVASDSSARRPQPGVRSAFRVLALGRTWVEEPGHCVYSLQCCQARAQLFHGILDLFTGCGVAEAECRGRPEGLAGNESNLVLVQEVHTQVLRRGHVGPGGRLSAKVGGYVGEEVKGALWRRADDVGNGAQEAKGKVPLGPQLRHVPRDNLVRRLQGRHARVLGERARARRNLALQLGRCLDYGHWRSEVAEAVARHGKGFGEAVDSERAISHAIECGKGNMGNVIGDALVDLV